MAQPCLLGQTLSAGRNTDCSRTINEYIVNMNTYCILPDVTFVCGFDPIFLLIVEHNFTAYYCFVILVVEDAVIADG